MTAQQHVARMSLRERCAQLVFPDYRFEDADPDRANHLVRKEGVGGLVLYGGSVFDVPSFVNWAQKVSKLPLLMAADYENGAGQQVSGATVFPPNMAVGATGSEDLAAAKARQTALEARALGVRWVLAPVVDLNSNPRNPVINTRAFGDDPELVIRLARAALKGLRLVKSMGCLKHFPGHGDAAVDSHLELPVLERPIEDLQASALRPFAELSGEADAIMAGHLLARALDPDAPCSLSRQAIAGYLRRELRFEGLVATDALNMGALSRFCTEAEAVERAVNAGADVLLHPADAVRAIDALEAAVKGGRVAEPTVDRAATRLLLAKERLGLFAERATDVGSVEHVAGSVAHRAFAQRIADAAVTLVRGSGRVTGPVSVLRVNDAGARGDLTVFEKQLASAAAVSADAPTCVVAVFFRPRAYAGTAELSEPLLAPILDAHKRFKEVLVVSFGSPYILRQLPDVAGTVCAWGEDEFCQRAAAKALTGAIEYAGRLPVRLEANTP